LLVVAIAQAPNRVRTPCFKCHVCFIKARDLELILVHFQSKAIAITDFSPHCSGQALSSFLFCSVLAVATLRSQERNSSYCMLWICEIVAAWKNLCYELYFHVDLY